jgi:putative membrane protein (TIGR04086 family)
MGAAAILRGVLFSAAITVVCVLLFSLIIGWTDMSDAVVRVINQIIKLGAVAAGVCFSVRRGEEAALRRGALIGLIYMGLGVLLYALLSAQKLTAVQYLTDLFMGIAAGGLTGMIVGTLKEKTA